MVLCMRKSPTNGKATNINIAKETWKMEAVLVAVVGMCSALPCRFLSFYVPANFALCKLLLSQRNPIVQ
jgi:hypothetical protein